MIGTDNNKPRIIINHVNNNDNAEDVCVDDVGGEGKVRGRIVHRQGLEDPTEMEGNLGEVANSDEEDNRVWVSDRQSIS